MTCFIDRKGKEIGKGKIRMTGKGRGVRRIGRGRRKKE